MRLAMFTFHPSPIQVDGKPLHGVRVGDSDVTEINLLDGVLIVSRGTTVWFTHTSYGTGVPIKPEPLGPYVPSEIGLLEQKSRSEDQSVRLMSGTEYVAQERKKQRSKKQ